MASVTVLSFMWLHPFLLVRTARVPRVGIELRVMRHRVKLEGGVQGDDEGEGANAAGEGVFRREVRESPVAQPGERR